MYIKYIKKITLIGSLLIVAALATGCSKVDHLLGTDALREPKAGGPVRLGQKSDPLQKPVKKEGAYRVALVLPTKAQQPSIAKVSESILKSSRLALRDLGNTPLELVFYATDEKPYSSQQAVATAVREGADLIVGPLLAPSVKAAQAALANVHIPMIAFSTDRDVVSGQEGTYLLSYMPEHEMVHLARYALSKQHEKFGILAPTTPYAQRVAMTFKSALNAEGGEITNGLYYNPKTSDFFGKVSQFAEKNSQNQETSWTAALLPDDAAGLRQVFTKLSAYNITPKTHLFLLTSVANDAAFLGTGQANGAVLAITDRGTMAFFETHYQTTYKEKPVPISSLGYDAISLAGALVKSNPVTPFTREAIESPEGFAGVGGVFRFKSNGLSERQLSIGQVQNGRLEQIVPARDHF